MLWTQNPEPPQKILAKQSTIHKAPCCVRVSNYWIRPKSFERLLKMNKVLATLIAGLFAVGAFAQAPAAAVAKPAPAPAVAAAPAMAAAPAAEAAPAKMSKTSKKTKTSKKAKKVAAAK
jgi:hypothetical protein